MYEVSLLKHIHVSTFIKQLKTRVRRWLNVQNVTLDVKRGNDILIYYPSHQQT